MRPQPAIPYRGDFLLGRRCATEALMRLGEARPIVARASTGEPIWPSGYVGTISHGGDVVCAAACLRTEVFSLGVDVDGGDPLTDDEAQLVCRPDEIADLALLGVRSIGCGAKIAFCAKEAFYKAYFSLARARLDFHDVSVDLSRNADGSSGAFEVRWIAPDRPLADRADLFVGRWALMEGVVFAGVTVRPSRRL